MSKLMKKFIIGLSIILLLNTVLSIYINLNFIERYFLYQEKQDMNRVFDQLTSSTKPLSETIHDIGNSEDVVIVWVEDSENNALLNERLRTAFLDKGISLKKYWLWDQDQQAVMQDGGKMKIYHQQKLNYSLLVEYLTLEDNFIAVAKIIPAMGRTLSLINKVTIIIFIGAGIVLLLLISILVHKITSPLKKIGETAKAISALDFKTVEIRTNDELEILANDINHMSIKLKDTHQKLEQKNQQMEELLSNVSHDLKTPVALIKAYTSGIKDGIDDGTFLDTIIIQNNRMEQIIEGLLNLAKVQHQEYYLEKIDISQYLFMLIQQYRLQANKQQLSFEYEIEDSIIVTANKQAIYLILSNLFSNAVKYAANGTIKIILCQQNGGNLFQIKNQVAPKNNIDVNRLWEPFYVAEESRNKDMSGTGLGLSIVKSAADKNGFDCKCMLENNIITFTVIL